MSARSAWALSPHGVSTVVSLEMRQRLRGNHWRMTVLAFASALIAVAVSALLWGGISSWLAPIMIGFTALCAVSSGMVVAARSVTNDRTHTGLGALFGTKLTTAEILVGKHLTAWSAAMAFPVLATPGLVLCASLETIPVHTALLGLAGVSVVSHFAVSATMLTASLIPFRASAMTAAITSSLFVIPVSLFAISGYLTSAPNGPATWRHLAAVGCLSLGSLIVTTWRMHKTPR